MSFFFQHFGLICVYSTVFIGLFSCHIFETNFARIYIGFLRTVSNFLLLHLIIRNLKIMMCFFGLKFSIIIIFPSISHFILNTTTITFGFDFLSSQLIEVVKLNGNISNQKENPLHFFNYTFSRPSNTCHKKCAKICEGPGQENKPIKTVLYKQTRP